MSYINYLEGRVRELETAARTKSMSENGGAPNTFRLLEEARETLKEAKKNGNKR